MARGALTVRIRNKRTRRMWRELVALEQEIRRLDKKPVAGAAEAALSHAIGNYRRLCRLRLIERGVDFADVLKRIRREKHIETPEPPPAGGFSRPDRVRVY